MKHFTSLTKFAKGIALLAVTAMSVLAAMAQEPSAAYKPASANDWWTGEVASNNKLAYIYNVGAGIFLTDENPTVTDINDAARWNMEASNGAYKFTNTYRIYMEKIMLWITKISTSDNATDFTLAEGTTQDRGTAYKLTKKAPLTDDTRMFNVDGKKYTAAKTASAYNDFLFISDTQKDTYDKYATLFKSAASYLDNEYIKKSDSATKALIDALESAAAGKYNTYATDKETLDNAITAAKAFIKGAANGWWRGEEVADGKEVYIFNVGAGTFVTDNVASETEVDNADIWTIKKTTSGHLKPKTYYSFTSDKGNNIYMEGGLSWTTEVSADMSATEFSLEDGESTGVGIAYKLKNTYVSARYLNVDGEKYTAAKTKSAANDFIFISKQQKADFDKYEELYNKAYQLRFNKIIEASEEMTDLLTEALNKTSNGSYASFNEDKVTLNDAIEAAEKYIAATTGINGIDNNADAQIKAVYDINGVRKSQLTKGINIVKLSNGKTKKVVVD